MRPTFVDHLRAAVRAVEPFPTTNIERLSRQIWQQAWPSGLINDAEAGELAELLHAKRQAAAVPSVPVGFACPKPTRRTAAQHEASIRRRRRLAACWPVPPELAQEFTISELAVLRVVADAMKPCGACGWPLEKIAAIAGTCRTVVKTALGKARRLRLLIVEERRRAGQRSLTNLVRFLCPIWRRWVLRRASGGGSGVIFPTTTIDQVKDPSSKQSVDNSIRKPLPPERPPD